MAPGKSDGAARASGPFWPSLTLAIVGLLWGLYWLPTRWMQAHGLGPAWMSLIISAVALLGSMPLLLRDRQQLRHLDAQALFTGLLLASSFSLYNVSLVLTTVVNAVLLFYLSPIWSTVLGVWLLGERLRPQRIAALLLGLLGLTVVIGFENGFPVPRQLGDWLALLSGMIWAYGSVRSYSGNAAGITGNVVAFNAGALAASLALIVLLPVAAAGALPDAATLLATLPVLVLLSLVFVLPTNVVMVWATQRLPAPRVGILLMTEVVAGTFSAALLAGETFGWRQIFGSALIIAAGMLEVMGRQSAGEKA